MLRFSETKVLLISPGKSGSITLRMLRALVSTVSTYASFFQSQYLKLDMSYYMSLNSQETQ